VAQVRAAHGDRWANIMQYYVDNFQDTLLGNIPGMRVLVEDLKTAGIGVWGLSNWNRELYPLAEQYCDVLTHLDGKIVSAFVGLRKPHRDIYERALHDFDIDAATSIFVDDKSMNILGANQAGIRGVRFSDSRKLRGLLIEQGIDIPAVK
jgi:putative hydrolase of the HAD superfamily